MKTIFFCLSLVLLQDLLFARAYIPTIEKGKVWHTDYMIPQQAGVKTYHTRVECDTMINLIQYQNVYECNDLGNASRRLGSIREDTVSHKVYFVDTGSSQENLLFDYDLNQGDIFNGLTVLSVNYQFRYGQLRKVLLFFTPFEWIEGIGETFYGIYNLTWGTGAVSGVTQLSSNCAPLSVSNTGLLQNIDFEYTAGIISVNSPIEENKHIEIYNSVGQLLYKAAFKKSAEVDISNFSKQLLVVHIYDTKERYTQKIVTQ